MCCVDSCNVTSRPRPECNAVPDTHCGGATPNSTRSLLQGHCGQPRMLPRATFVGSIRNKLYEPFAQKVQQLSSPIFSFSVPPLNLADVFCGFPLVHRRLYQFVFSCNPGLIWDQWSVTKSADNPGSDGAMRVRVDVGRVPNIISLDPVRSGG